MPEVPEPLMRCDKAFERLAPVLLGRHAAARQHGFEAFQQLFGDNQVLGIAGMVERDKYLVRQPAALPRSGSTLVGHLGLAFG